MNLNIDQLPDDPVQLKNILSEVSSQYENKFEKQKKQYEKQLKEERFRYQVLEEKFKLFRHRFFSRKSEKLTEEEKLQLRLFNEAESGVDEEESKDAPASDGITVKSYTRKKRGRKPLSELLPRKKVIHDLSDEEKKCPCCGEERPCIGEDITEELDIIPAVIQVLQHIRLKYGPCSCKEFHEKEISGIKSAPVPARLIPHSIASPGLLSYILVSKYVDALPFYRQSKMFARIEVDISRSTLCNWAILAAEKCKDLISLMWEEVKSGPLIQMDETTVQVLKEPGRDPTTKSYMWVTVGYPEQGRPVVLYEYHPGRSKEIPLSILEEYKGYLQSDGYAGYNAAGSLPDIIHIGCLAHARRYFHDAFKLSKKSNTVKRSLYYFQKIYKIEKELRKENLSPDEFVEERKKEVVPILDEFHKFLQEKRDTIPPESKLGEAIKYTLNGWDKLVKYLDAHFLTPDNTVVERAIRPFAVGRRNWLFSNTPRGAEASAIIYSLVETAKANGLEPYRYLKFLFTKLPQISSKDELRDLLPTRITPEIIQKA